MMKEMNIYIGVLCRELNVLGGIYCYGFDFKKLYVKKYVKGANINEWIR